MLCSTVGPTGAVLTALLILCGSPASAGSAPLEQVAANDNTRPAGRREEGRTTLRLRAAPGRWQPEGSDGPALLVDAFGEVDGSLTVPAPLVRVVEGTELVVSIRNDLKTALRVHGLCARDGRACPPVDVRPGENRELRFISGQAGTYHYWATSIGAPVPFRELAGALVVDAAADVTPDRVFVITEWSSLTTADLGAIFAADVSNEAFAALRPRLTFVINGLSWPATERLTYRRGDRVRWRIVNLSSQSHPMHLHGFYFTVRTTGDGLRDNQVAGGEGRRVVTEVIRSAGTMRMEWEAEEEGNWLFHCHIMFHVTPDRALSASPEAHAHHGDRALGMAGMVLGVTVLPAARDGHATTPVGPENARPSSPSTPPRKLTLEMWAMARDRDEAPAAGFSLVEGGTGPADVRAPGPPLVLRLGEPVAITVVNRLDRPTSLHWHGIELPSVYDGVHGWSGRGTQVAPMIEPGGSWVVRFTPRRTGTFIYHTHLHDYRQLTSGLYGAIVVLGPGEAFDPSTDHVVVLGRNSAADTASIVEDPASTVINGERSPRFTWRSGTAHRVRLINITPDDMFTVSLAGGSAAPTWTPLTKDGAPVPASDAGRTPATARIAVGETYDFVVETSPGRAGWWLEVRTPSGRWQAQARITVRPDP
jgi:FtsP/CotA-like multicopper oxidase with cupredoxin domain